MCSSKQREKREIWDLPEIIHSVGVGIGWLAEKTEVQTCLILNFYIKFLLVRTLVEAALTSIMK